MEIQNETSVNFFSEVLKELRFNQNLQQYPGSIMDKVLSNLDYPTMGRLLGECFEYWKDSHYKFDADGENALEVFVAEAMLETLTTFGVYIQGRRNVDWNTKRLNDIIGMLGKGITPFIN